MTTFPPSGFIQGESYVEGITVYKPAPLPKEKIPDTVDFKCPQCGSTTAYNIEAGGLKCTNCGYYEPPEKEVVGKGAEQFEFKVETLEQAAQGWGELRKQIECRNCGAITVLDPGQLTHTCPFCGSAKVIQGEAVQSTLRPRFLIPFHIEEENCYSITTEWMGSSWILPRKLKQAARLGQFTGIYLPFWTFDARAHADWKAEVGYEETERYYSDGEWKTRTVVRWRWRSGSVTRTFDDAVTSGTKQISQGILDQMNNFRIGELTPYEPKFLAGWQAQAYEIPLEAAWETARRRFRDMTRRSCEADALSGDGDRVRNMSVSIDFQDESWRYILLPVYLAPYNFDGETYHIVVNGQTGSIGGTRPVDWNKVWMAAAALFIPALLAGGIGLFVPPLLCGSAVLLAGAVGGTIWMVSHARKIENPDQETLQWKPF